MASLLEDLYPHVAYFVDVVGWIQVGRDDDSPLTSFIRALDAGGMLWEGQDEYPSLDAAIQDLEAFLQRWMPEQGIDIHQ